MGFLIPGYDGYMMYKKYLKTIAGNQIVQERINIMEFFDEYGPKATKTAYGFSRSTVYLWKKMYKESKYDPTSLIPNSKAPKTVRNMYIDPRIIKFIKDLRKRYHRLGKCKIKSLLDPFCEKEGIPKISESTIGRIIQKYNMTYPPPNAHIKKHKRKKKQRISSRYKTTYAGELVQIDTIVKYVDGIKLYIHTAVDVYSRYSFAYSYKRLSSRTALDFYQKLKYCAPFKIAGVKTDNGLEFHGDFSEYLKQQSVKHYYSYPKSPKSNAYVERFNRSIQEEFVEYNLEYVYEIDEFNSKLCEYLIFFNGVRPHYGVNMKSPLAYLVFNGHLSNMSWTYTLFSKKFGIVV